MSTFGLSRKTALVTGAGGFIGSHLTERLLGTGVRTRAFLRYNSRSDMGYLRDLPGKHQGDLEIFWGDLRDPQTVREAMKNVDVVFHLGALIAIPYSYERPSEFVQTNVVGTLNVLNAARELETPRVVQTSTSEVYGTACYSPIDEAHPRQPQSPYSASKISADSLCRSFYCSYGLPVVTVRPFNTYGPRQSARAVIPTIIAQALSAPELRLGSLTPLRDLTFVSDTVEGFIRAAEAAGVEGEDINLGTGECVSIGDLVRMIQGMLECDKKVVCEERRVRPEASEVWKLCSDNTKAGALLGWAPRVSLIDGLARTIDWVRENLGTFQVDEYTV